jgi:hypothetical protein
MRTAPTSPAKTWQQTRPRIYLLDNGDVSGKIVTLIHAMARTLLHTEETVIVGTRDGLLPLVDWRYSCFGGSKDAA